MGRELFDYAFKQYARRWAFRHPTPADFFRTMEDASGEDLDWFWRGWFYSTDVCDISLDSVKYARADVNSEVPQQLREGVSLQEVPQPILNTFDDVSGIKNRQDPTHTYQTNADTTLRDFYWRYARGLVPYDSTKYSVIVPAGAEQADAATKQALATKHFYEVNLSNKGGLTMPIIIEWTYTDGTKEVTRIPAQIWRYNENVVTKFFMKDKEVAAIKLDPLRETADINESNNTWGRTEQAASRFKVFKSKQASSRGQSTGVNPMQKAKTTTGY
jgi:hypothetical protein